MTADTCPVLPVVGTMMLCLSQRSLSCSMEPACMYNMHWLIYAITEANFGTKLSYLTVLTNRG